MTEVRERGLGLKCTRKPSTLTHTTSSAVCRWGGGSADSLHHRVTVVGLEEALKPADMCLSTWPDGTHSHSCQEQALASRTSSLSSLFHLSLWKSKMVSGPLKRFSRATATDQHIDEEGKPVTHGPASQPSQGTWNRTLSQRLGFKVIFPLAQSLWGLALSFPGFHLSPFP